MQQFKGHEDMFARQFLRPVSDAVSVIEEHAHAERIALSTYIDVYTRCSDGAESWHGHLRVDWRLEQDGFVGLHGGAPCPAAEHHHARLEAWAIACESLLQTPEVRGLWSCAAENNAPAINFLKRSGFQPVRLVRRPDGSRVVQMALFPHNVPAWLRSMGALAARPWHVPATAGVPLGASAPAPPQLRAPDGWSPLQGSEALPFLAEANARGGAAAWLGWPLPPAEVAAARSVDVAASAFGVLVLGARDAEGNPAGMLVVAPPTERWLTVRGGPWRTGLEGTIAKWVHSLFEHGHVERMEIAVPAPAGAVLQAWTCMGAVVEGALTMDRSGGITSYVASILRDDLRTPLTYAPEIRQRR